MHDGGVELQSLLCIAIGTVLIHCLLHASGTLYAGGGIGECDGVEGD